MISNKTRKDIKTNKGITLIALVVTIIVLIILAGVSISLILGQDGIVRRATEGRDKYSNAAAYENEQLANVDAYALNMGSVAGGSSTPPAGPTVPYNNPYIPAGFTHTEGEWNNGYTIKNSSTNDEFVWVPCTLTATSETVAFAKITTAGTKYNSNNLTDITDQGTSAGLIRTSVGTYGGFYIAKYEASNSSGTAKSVPNATPWTDISRTDAITKAEAMVSTADGVKSALISGECWDTTLQWMVKTGNTGYDTNSTGKGWYYENANENKKATGTSVATANANRVNNIWDMAGNVYEWTTENCKYNGNDYLVFRGGSCKGNASDFPAASRYHSNVGASSYVGFRPVLYK